MKSRWLTVAIVALLFLAAISAYAVDDINFSTMTSTIGLTIWQVYDISADASAAVTLVAAPGAGSRLNITRATLSTASAIYVTLMHDNGVPVLGPYYFSTGGPGTIVVDLRHAPRYLHDNEALQYLTSGAGAVTVEVEGFTSD
jgi:hypothetical protein